MSDLSIVICAIIGIFVIPFIFSFLLALFVVEEMPNENRRPSSINDCFKCMSYDGFSDTKYSTYQRLFLILQIPLFGFIVTITLMVCFLIYCLFGCLGYIIMRIPGVKPLCNSISNIYNKIINYNFR